MLILSETTDNLEVVLNTAATTSNMQCYSTYRDVTTTEFTPGRSVATTNGDTDVVLVPAPAASTQRVIDYVSIYNADTASKTVTVKLDADGTEYIFHSAALAAGETLTYQDSVGWQIRGTDGNVKIVQTYNYQVATESNWTEVVLAEDVGNNNAVANTLEDVTGLAFAVTTGNTYFFEIYIPYTSQATTTGSRWTINGPAFELLHYTSEYTLAATTKTLNSATAYQIPAASSATSLTAGNMATIWGFVRPTADGTIQVQHASEIANSLITAKAGAFIRYKRVI